MPDILCPICQRPNDPNAERCWYCQAVLTHENTSEKNGNTDWLNEFRDNSKQSLEPAPLDQPSESVDKKKEEVPDWLARIREREQMEHDSQPDENANAKPEEKKDDLPDWLKEIKAGNSGKKAETVQPEDATPSILSSESPLPETGSTQQSANIKKEEEDTEEWLSHLAAWKPDESDENAEGETNVTDKQVQSPRVSNPTLSVSSLSEWDNIKQKPDDLDQIEGWQNIPQEGIELDSSLTTDRKPEDETQPNQVEIVDGKSELNGFDVDELRNSLVSQNTNSKNEENLFESEETSTLKGDEQKNENPEEERLASRIFELEKPEEETGDSGSTIETEKPFYIDEIPENPPFLKDDLPDWLATAAFEKKPRKTTEAISEEFDANKLEADLEKANIPAWLQAIRPRNMDEISEPATQSFQNVETQGLLTGIADTLQSPKIDGQYRKPVGYGSALKVSERQKANANLLASLVEETLDIKDNDQTRDDRLKKKFWQILLAVIMISIMLVANDLFRRYTIQPVLFAPEVVAVYDTVDTLPDSAPVLLTADFEPAVTGELSWSSQVLFEHLMRRNLNLVILSTTPAGSTILSEMLNTAGQNVPGYDLSTHVVNLGYLPGAALGLQSMTENLQAAMPYTHDFQIAWDSTVLQAVNKLSDFSAVIVLSDKAESARVWVEQIQPKLESTPLMFVISAQAAPMLQPYYQSAQISGFIAGFNGSLSYEKIFQQSSSASSHMSAFQASILFLTILLLLGGLIHLIRPAASDRKR